MAVKVYIERSYTVQGQPPTTVKVEGDTSTEAVDALNQTKDQLYPELLLENN